MGSLKVHAEPQSRRGELHLTENEVATIIVDAVYRVHTTPGPGLLESVYVAVLAHEIGKRGLGVTRQVPVAVHYDALVFEEGFRADLVVADLVIVEVKSTESTHPGLQEAAFDLPSAVWQELSGKRLGLLVNPSADLPIRASLAQGRRQPRGERSAAPLPTLHHAPLLPRPGAHQVHGQMAENHQVLRRVAGTHGALVFAEGGVQHPVELVLNAPVVANHARNRAGRGVRVAHDEVGTFCRVPPGADVMPLARHHADTVEAGPVASLSHPPQVPGVMVSHDYQASSVSNLDRCLVRASG